MKQIRKLLIITGAICASSCAWSDDKNSEAICAKYFNPGFFQKLFGALEPSRPVHEFDWCMNERSRSAITMGDFIYINKNLDDFGFRKSMDEITEVNEVRLWNNSQFQNIGEQTDASLPSFAIKGSQVEESRKKENLNTLNGFKTISK